MYHLFRQECICRSIPMFRRFHSFGTWQFSGEGPWVMDEHRKVLRADPEFPALEFERDQGNLLAGAVACDALWFVVLSGGHHDPSGY